MFLIIVILDEESKNFKNTEIWNQFRQTGRIINQFLWLLFNSDKFGKTSSPWGNNPFLGKAYWSH